MRINNIGIRACFLSIQFFFADPCIAQDKTKNNTGQTSSWDLQTFLKAGIDPYFVESRDTVSSFGPKCIVREVIQDRKGNFWFATWQGIMGYDGNVFTNYTLKYDLIHFHVVSLFEDTKGNLWFGTARGGLYQYNGTSFTLFTNKDGLADSTIICMAEDSKGNIWFGTEQGISRYDGKTFTSFTTEDGLSGNYINSIIEDKTGKIWFGGDGITIYDSKRNSFSKWNSEKELFKKRISGLLEDNSGNIWIGTFGGLTCYNGNNFTDYLSPYLTYYLIEGKPGSIWLTHSEPNTKHQNLPCQVLYKYDGSQAQGTFFKKILEKNEPGDFQIFGKTEDQHGNIWFGTMKGVCRYDGKTYTYFTE